jgi:hypothetical protein
MAASGRSLSDRAETATALKRRTRLMNNAHLAFLASPDWAHMLETDLFPWIDRVANLGDDLLEVGPGPGLTTDLLRRRAARVTVVEIDDGRLAEALSRRLAGTNMEVIHGHAAATGSRDLDVIRTFHEGDDFLPMADDTVVGRLQHAGFVDVDVEIGDYELRFRARKPTGHCAGDRRGDVPFAPEANPSAGDADLR